ncbi:MAG: TetR/AcrR family transcriptional regulator [Lachnospiraceae bacterium]
MNKVITSKEAILAISCKMAAKDGIQALNMRSVASACGVAVGSIYNYFPSKADLIASTIEMVWRDIFQMEEGYKDIYSFTDCVLWIFDSVCESAAQFPDFFTMHAMGISTSDKETGRRTMDRYLEHIKQGMLIALQRDKEVRRDAFDEAFQMEAFVEFVFGNLWTLFIQKQQSCDILLEIIRRSIYAQSHDEPR